VSRTTTDAVAQGCPVHESFDPLSPEYLADPYAVLASLPLEEGPVFYAPSIGYHAVTRYADVMQVYGDPQTYSAAVAQQPLATLIPEAQQILLDGGHRPQPSMVSLDEPAHPRLRRPATRAFTVKRVNDMAPTIRATARELLDVVGDTDRFDLVAALAFPLPANAIFSLLGVPTDDYEQLKRWCGYRAALSWGRPDPDDQVEIAGNLVAYRRYLRELVEAKVEDRADDLTSDLLAIHDEDPERLTLAEIASILFSLSFAGHETTTGLIGNTVRGCWRSPHAGTRSWPSPH
jgi:cytochrome P450